MIIAALVEIATKAVMIIYILTKVAVTGSTSHQHAIKIEEIASKNSSK